MIPSIVHCSKMNNQDPPPYPDQGPGEQEPNDQDEQRKWRNIFDGIQGFLLVAVVAMTMAELVLAVRNRHLAKKALRIAGAANGTAEAAIGTANKVSTQSIDIAGSELRHLYRIECQQPYGSGQPAVASCDKPAVGC